MSDGEFNYNFHRVDEFVESLKHRIANNGICDGDGGKDDLSPISIQMMEDLARMSESLSELMRTAIKLYEGDIGEQTFQEEFNDHIGKIGRIANQGT